MLKGAGMQEAECAVGLWEPLGPPLCSSTLTPPCLPTLILRATEAPQLLWLH